LPEPGHTFASRAPRAAVSAQVTQDELGAGAAGDLSMAAVVIVFGIVAAIAAGFLLLRRR